MNESHEYPQYESGNEGHIDPQAAGGSIGGSLAGGLLGQQLFGKKGGKAGKIIGGTLGAFLPFSAGPDADGPTEIEMQSVVSVLQKLATAKKKKLVDSIASNPAVVLGKSLGLFEAGPQAIAEAPTDMELQGFWKVVTKLAYANSAKAGANAGGQVAVLSAAPSGASDDEPTDVELQGVVSFLKKVAKKTADNADTVVKVAKQASDIAHTVGLLEAGAPTAQPDGDAAQRQLIALLQQAMPALVAIAQAQHSGSQN